MQTWIALLRGINVGGKNRLPMKELVRELEQLDLVNVRTYIQSGNAVFQAPRSKIAKLGDRIGQRIEQSHGFQPRVLILSAGDLQRASKANPFHEAQQEAKTLHLFFLSAVPETPDLPGLQERKEPSERFELIRDVFYLHAPRGLARSKLAASVEKRLGVAATGRNWRTVQKLIEMTAAAP